VLPPKRSERCIGLHNPACGGPPTPIWLLRAITKGGFHAFAA
jgi:hypothetical protein